jgi:hypothetical protein
MLVCELIFKLSDFTGIKQKKSTKHGRTGPVCWANKASRAIFASQSGNIGLL